MDDDINYPVLALKCAERFGRDFTPDDVAETWAFSVPAFHTCTAERAVIRNLLLGKLPPATAQYLNPYREWIGAQIRADFWGYINPGDPVGAARMAYRDACVSHTKNGVYGEMYIAALVSLCFSDELTMTQRVSGAMGQIPAGSRLHEGLRQVCDMVREGKGFDEIMAFVHAHYDEADPFDWCLTTPNAMLVTGCVLTIPDFDDAIAAAVKAGFDTDCNAATVGSILGALHGIDAIDRRWYASFPDEIHSGVHGYSCLKFDDVTHRTLALMQT